MIKNFLLPVFAATSLVLVGCGTSALNKEAGESSSSLKGVYDGQYYLQLQPAGDTDVYKFEICLMGSLNSQENLAGNCVGALKTSTGEDLLLTMKTLSELSLTESEKITLLKNHEEYLAYEQSLKRRVGDAAEALGMSSGIGIGGGIVTIASKNFTNEMAERAVSIAAEIREAKQNAQNPLQKANAAALIDEAERIVKLTKQAKKLLPPTFMLATAAAVFGVGYLFAKDHISAHVNVQDVLAQHDELSTLIRYGSPLLSVEDTMNESISSVETVLLNFAKWQALVSSYSSDSNVVVEKICLPKASSIQGGSLEADCHTIDL